VGVPKVLDKRHFVQVVHQELVAHDGEIFRPVLWRSGCSGVLVRVVLVFVSEDLRDLWRHGWVLCIVTMNHIMPCLDDTKGTEVMIRMAMRDPDHPQFLQNFDEFMRLIDTLELSERVLTSVEKI
jgi:hypothetical protein